TGPPYGASWERDGTIVYGQADGAYRVPAGGGTPEKIMAVAEAERVYGPRLLPGGEWLLASVAAGKTYPRWEQAQIVAQSLRSEERRVLFSGGSDARYVPTGHLVFMIKDVLHALAFDARTLRVAGGPVPVVKGLQRAVYPRDEGTGFASFGISEDG